MRFKTSSYVLTAVVILIITVLWFGINSPSSHGPDNCLFSQPFSCMDHEIGDGVDITIMNGGEAVHDVIISSKPCGDTVLLGTLERGEETTFTVCEGIEAETIDLEVAYIQDELSHTRPGYVKR